MCSDITDLLWLFPKENLWENQEMVGYEGDTWTGSGGYDVPKRIA